VTHDRPPATERIRRVLKLDAFGEDQRHVMTEDSNLADAIRHDASRRTIEQNDL